jgi:hypothetical protein
MVESIPLYGLTVINVPGPNENIELESACEIFLLSSAMAAEQISNVREIISILFAINSRPFELVGFPDVPVGVKSSFQLRLIYIYRHPPIFILPAFFIEISRCGNGIVRPLLSSASLTLAVVSK